jgi:hypothetical protein
MSKRFWIIFIALLVSAYLLAHVAVLGVRQYRTAKSAAFCEAVVRLPPETLRDLAMRCDRLAHEAARAETNLWFTDAATLNQLAVLGRTPYAIFAEKDSVAVKYLRGHWSYSTLMLWSEGPSTNGHPAMTLRIAYGSGGWNVLYKKDARDP